jgi:hypothetical protein
MKAVVMGAFLRKGPLGRFCKGVDVYLALREDTGRASPVRDFPLKAFMALSSVSK